MSNTKETQKKNREKAMQDAKRAKSIKITLIAVVVLAVLGLTGWIIGIKIVTNIKSIPNFSEGLNDDGTIKGVKATDYVTLCDYKNITIPKSELEVSEEEMKSYMDYLVQQYPEMVTDPGITIKNGDTINMDYVGKIDGVAFNGGTTNGQGTTSTMGSGAYIDGFEDQIIGHNIGETFDIYVTFPETYTNELAGKDAVFTITINYLEQVPEFDDEFVEKNLADIALTVDGFKKYYNDIKYQKALYVYVQEYVVENSYVKDYPKDYLEILKGKMKYDDEQTYESENKSYMQQYGVKKYANLSEYTGFEYSKDYVSFLSQQAMSQLDTDLIYQAIIEDAGLTVSSEDVSEYLLTLNLDDSYYQTTENTYGRGYLYNKSMVYTVIKYLADMVTVVD